MIRSLTTGESFLRLILATLLAATAAPVIAQTPAADPHANHQMRSASVAAPKTIAEAVADARRKPANVARDKYRHPVETLTFFGISPASTVVEIYPGGGWYTEILAPLLRERGRYIAATQPPSKYRAATEALIASDPARFDKVTMTVLDPGKPSAIAPAGTADAVLTFRNVHNLIMEGDAAARQAFADFYKALKPGGVLGVVDHRLPEGADAAREKSSGYVKRSTVVRFAEAAGFKLDAESEINANPRDTADWPKGVWTLPPTLAEGEANRTKYLAIGESDRMTLRFIKPKV
jgi:predicted methyltransferase